MTLSSTGAKNRFKEVKALLGAELVWGKGFLSSREFRESLVKNHFPLFATSSFLKIRHTPAHGDGQISSDDLRSDLSDANKNSCGF